MQNVEGTERSRRSIGKTALAAIVLLIAAWIVIKVVVGIVTALFVPILVIVAIAAIIWAFRVLF